MTAIPTSPIAPTPFAHEFEHSKLTCRSSDTSESLRCGELNKTPVRAALKDSEQYAIVEYIDGPRLVKRLLRPRPKRVYLDVAGPTLRKAMDSLVLQFSQLTLRDPLPELFPPYSCTVDTSQPTVDQILIPVDSGESSIEKEGEVSSLVVSEVAMHAPLHC